MGMRLDLSYEEINQAESVREYIAEKGVWV
jgi:hypothetical protein